MFLPEDTLYQCINKLYNLLFRFGGNMECAKDQLVLKMIMKYNNSCIPDNHGCVSSLMENVGKIFIIDDNESILRVKEVTGCHNVPLFKFYLEKI